ncbi:MAG: magnesium transporter CorA family protein [Lentisphaeria bacterium]|nr:magnesium transporter CorA family protein [Lentisphaeria bacterium]
MLKFYNLADGRIQRCAEGETGIIQVYSNPSEEEQQYLIEKCGIDPHTLASALDKDEVSRIEYEDSHVAVIMKRPRDFQIGGRLEFRVSSIGAFLFKDKLIVLQADNMPLFEHGRIFLRGNTVSGLLLRLLHHATRHFLQDLRMISSISDEIENKIEFAVTNKSLLNMFSLHKSLTYYQSATEANQVLLSRLRSNRSRIGFNEDEEEFLEDIAVENQQCVNISHIYTEVLLRMSDARMAVGNNNLARIMKYLAVINIVFMPLTVLTGLGGMSEFTMMTQGMGWPHAYSLLVLILVIIGYLTYVVVMKIGSPETRNRSGNNSRNSRKR